MATNAAATPATLAMPGPIDNASSTSPAQQISGNKATDVSETDMTSAASHEISTPNDDDGGRPACFANTFQELTFVFITTFACAMGAFLAGTTSVIPYFVQVDLNMTQAQLTWLTSSSLLSSGTFLLFFGRLADLFGRKTLLVTSFAFFTVFTLGAGFARDPITLDVLNGVLGLATAAALPPAQGSLSVIYGKPSRRKNAAFACFSAGNPIGFAMGMVFGAIATQLFGWRASYWLLAIMYAFLTVAAVFAMPKDTTPKRKLDWQSVKEFDIVGTVLVVAGVGMFSAALTLGADAQDGFKTDYVLALLIVGFCIIVAFVFWDLHYPHPLLPMYIWKDRDFSIVVVIVSLGLAAFGPSCFFTALFFQRVWGYSAISTAVHLLPLVVMGIIVNIFAGFMMHRVNNKLLMFVGTMAYTLCMTLLALSKVNITYWAFIFPAFCLCVIGADLNFNVANMYVMTSLPAHQQSIASGILQTSLKLMQTISFGVATAIYDSVAKSMTRWGGYYADSPQSQAYSAVFWFVAGISAFSVVLTCFLTIRTQGGKSDGADGAAAAAAAAAGAEREKAWAI